MVEVMTAVRSSSDEPVFVRGVRVRDPLTAFQAGLGHLSGDRAQCVIPTLDLHAHVTLPVLGRFRRCGIVRRPSEVTASKRALADVGVNSPARYLSELSGGNQQRALLARWLLADVEVLVADEPTVGVDVKARGLILDDLREFGHRKALVLSSSEPEELAAICDRVLCFRDGAVVAEVSGEALTTSAILNAIT
jgi:ABC-type sugar transport system ATPase subunit